MSIIRAFMLPLLLSSCAWLSACGGGSAKSDDAPAGPKLYWSVELVGKGVAKPDPIDTDIDRLFDDGSILAKLSSSGGRDVGLRGTDGTWHVLMPPPSDANSTFGYLTYYDDDRNFGGVSSTGGYVVLDGVLSKCSEKIGGFCEPRGKLPDGSVLTLTTNEQGNTDLQSWQPGQNDALDIADIFYEANAANGNSAAFSRLASDGTILMLPFMPASGLGGTRNSTIVVLKEKQPVRLDSTEFNHGEPVDRDTEATLGQAVFGITRAGAILGQKAGLAVLKTDDDYDVVSDSLAQPIAANTVRDVVYRSYEGGYFYRWQGQTYALDPGDWSSVAGAFYDDLHLDIVDINASGQVLFAGSARPGEAGYRLYLATPSTTPPPPHLFAHLTFKKVSGGAAPETMDVAVATDVVGMLSPGSLTFNVTSPSSDNPGKARAFNVALTRSTGMFQAGTPLGVTTSVTPDGPVLATVTYADAPLAGIAQSGNLVLQNVADASFKVSIENVLMKDAKTGNAFTIDGYAEVQQ